MEQKVIYGDLLDLAEAGMFDVIIHGCNCFTTMGSGIAKKLSDRWRAVSEADKVTGYGYKDKLGTISEAYILRQKLSDPVYWTDENDVVYEQRQDPFDPGMFTVANAYCQFHYGWGYKYLQLDYLKLCLYAVACRYPDAKIGYPLIGCGRAGGAWSEVEPIIETTLGLTDHTLVLLPGTSVEDTESNLRLVPAF